MKTYKLYAVVLCMFLFIGCGTKNYKLKSSIVSDVDMYNCLMSSTNGPGMTLTPKLEDNSYKNLEYNWKLDNTIDKLTHNQTVAGEDGFILLYFGIPDDEKIDPVMIPDYSKIYRTIKVTLEVKDKDSGEIISKSELLIDDYYGNYKVRKTS